MSETNKQRCLPCEGLDARALLDEGVVHDRVKKELPLWTVEKMEKQQDKQQGPGSEGIPFLRRTFVARDFQAALDAVNKFGSIAERESHHPDLHITRYRTVTVEIYTHKLGGITENDMMLASMLDEEVRIVYSPKWLREHPMAAETSQLEEK